jgi:hypothetical protein
MSIFSTILEKLGLRHAEAPASSGPAIQPPATATTATPPPAAIPMPAPATPVPQAISEVDVTAKLEELAASHHEKLNWRVSIVDLLKLLGLDSSLDARKGLASELGCPADKMGDSAQMNMWLHKTVLQRLADNGGNIPKELL